MAVKVLDLKGLKCPQPVLKMLTASRALAPGDILEAVADCASFDKDVRDWCNRTKKALLWMRSDGGTKRCQVRN